MISQKFPVRVNSDRDFFVSTTKNCRPLQKFCKERQCFFIYFYSYTFSCLLFLSSSYCKGSSCQGNGRNTANYNCPHAQICCLRWRWNTACAAAACCHNCCCGYNRRCWLCYGQRGCHSCLNRCRLYRHGRCRNWCCSSIITQTRYLESHRQSLSNCSLFRKIAIVCSGLVAECLPEPNPNRRSDNHN